MKLMYLCGIGTKMVDADFWIVRKGNDKTCGMPTKEYKPDHIGIKVVATNILLPDYLYYMMMTAKNVGEFEPFIHGATNQKNIRVQDIKNWEFDKFLAKMQGKKP